MFKSKIAILIILLGAVSLFAQEKKKDMPLNLGLYGGLNFNFHTPNFIYGVYDETNTFVGNMRHNSNSTGLAGNFGFILNIPFDNMFVLSGRIGYNMLNGELTDTVGTNKTNAKIGMLEISPVLQIHNLIEDQGLYLLAGLEFGIPMGKTYNATYFQPLNNTTYNIPDTDISDMNTRFALAIGAGWMFEVSDDVFLSPEVSYRLPFSKVSKNEMFDTWEVPQLRASLALTFGIGSDDKPLEEEKQAGEINVGMANVIGLDMNGNELPLNKIQVEEVQYAELFPLLPYVFFDENKEEPASTTQRLFASREAGSFSIETLEPDAVKINSQTLDIIGTRMQADKNAAIKLIGTVDAKNESAKSDLPKKRAEFAKNYLVVNYGIEPGRITVETTGLPSKPSSVRDPEGIEENRRVEIVPMNANSSLLKPIIIQSDRQRLTTPPVVQFTPDISSVDEIDGWELEIKQADRLLKRYSGYGKPEKIQWSISANELSANDIPVDYSLSAWTKAGKKGNYNGSIPAEYFSVTKKKSEERADKTISKFSLVLFDFNSPEISDLDQRVINENIIPAIKFNSTVQIYGYTDRIGSEDYNKKLAQQRASNARDLLKSKAKDAKYEVFGVGEGVQVYDNNLTVGRQLSRTVQVYVITPKN